MNIKRAYKTELDLNNEQRTACMKHAGAARYAYNWGLGRRIKAYREEGKTLNAISLHKELNKLKKTELPWMYEVSKCAPQEALRDLDKAYISFFKGLSDYPQFKSKKKGICPFRLTGTIKISEDSVQLPRLGKIKLKADGIAFKNPRSLIKNEKKLKRIQREVSRKKKGSRNRRSAVRRVQRQHAHIKNIRTDAIHKATTELAKTKSVIVVEDLNVSGMMSNGNLAKHISDAGMREFRRQLEYKTVWYGSNLKIADRWYPSSKMCSICGHVIDRDWNASRNLERLAASSSESINACQSREVHVDAISIHQVPASEAGIERQ